MRDTTHEDVRLLKDSNNNNWETRDLRNLGQACKGDTSMTHVHTDSSISVFSVYPAAVYCMSWVVGRVLIDFLLDTWAADCLLRKDVWDCTNTTHCSLRPWNGSRLVSIDRSPVQFLWVAQLDITVQEVKIQQEVIIVVNLTAMGILNWSWFFGMQSEQYWHE